MKYIYSTSQMSKLSLTLHTFSITGSVAGLFLTVITKQTATTISSRNTNSTMIGTIRSLKSSEKLKPIQFTQV